MKAEEIVHPIVELNGVCLQYESAGQIITALDGVNFAVERGTVVAVLGRSGSGKSSLMSVLSLLRTPTHGRVRLNGEDVQQMTIALRTQLRAANIGIVFQSFHLEPSLTAAENVMLPWFTGATQGSYRNALKKAGEIMEQLGIGSLTKRRRGQMSGGQRQRVAIARALFNQPPLLLADEPTGNLDESTADEVSRIFRELPETFGTAVVVVTHDISIANMADRRYDIVEGVLHQDFTGADT